VRRLSPDTNAAAVYFPGQECLNDEVKAPSGQESFHATQREVYTCFELSALIRKTVKSR